MPDPSLRDALRSVRDDAEGLERLHARLPILLERARRAREEAADPRVQLAWLAPRWLGRMVAVAAVVTLAALLWPAATPRGASEASLDGWALSGSTAEDADPVLRALLR
jgi:hypothetical protein